MNMESLMGGASGWSQVRVMWEMGLCERRCKMFSTSFRLRLVRVKVFPENRYFPEMLFSGKENVFMCLVAFQKNFRKIFSDVWLYS